MSEPDSGGPCQHQRAVSAEQLIVLALLVAAFVAGYIARDPPRREQPPEPEAEPATEPEPETELSPEPDALDAYEEAVDAWLEGRDTTAAIAALRSANERRDDPAIRDALAILSLSLRGHRLDAATSRALDAVEARLER